jgi:TrmH family RNA methyltransferase
MTRSAPIDPIDSAQNSAVVAARALLARKGRAAASAFLVEGPHAVGEAIAGGAAVRLVFLTPDAATDEAELVRAATAAGVSVRSVTARVLARLSDTVTPQGVIAVVEIPSTALGDVLGADPRLVVILERIADPGNAGTVIRTADAAGAGAVIVTPDSVDVWSGKCTRATAGSIFHVPTLTGVPVDAAVAQLRARGGRVLATASDGEHDLDDLTDAGELSGPTAWIFGNEAHGVSAQARGLADRVVRLPIYGKAESLNLAAAAAICLYASARAQRA